MALRYKLKMLEDNDTVKKYVFFSQLDARNFHKFIKIYKDETGCGNGYSAYWPIGSPALKIIHFDPKKNRINCDDVKGMLRRILRVRFTTNEPDIETFPWMIENTDDGIKFELGDLPPVQRPTVGDMYRIPRSRFGFFPNLDEVLEYNEGRVVEDLGDTLRVLPCHIDCDPDREIKLFEIKASQAIKIDDWVKQMRGDKYKEYSQRI